MCKLITAFVCASLMHISLSLDDGVLNVILKRLQTIEDSVHDLKVTHLYVIQAKNSDILHLRT